MLFRNLGVLTPVDPPIAIGTGVIATGNDIEMDWAESAPVTGDRGAKPRGQVEIFF